MKTPPINWTDLINMGLDPSSIISSYDNQTYKIEPSPPLLLAKLFKELASYPAPEDNDMAYLRHIRDLLIALTDWTQYADSPLSSDQKIIWANYRQSLRDLPANYNGNGPIPWPSIPN
jgi:hypothetical protein